MKKIVLAGHENMVALGHYSNQILDLLGIGKGAFVSDETMLWDFGTDQEDLDQIGELVGFTVSKEDYLLDVCVRWRNLADISIA